MQILPINTWEIRSQIIDSKETFFYYARPDRLRIGDLITLVDRQRIGIVISTSIHKDPLDDFDQTSVHYIVLCNF